jgi:hypothetical protein
MVVRRALLALTGLLVMLGASRVQSAWATRQLAREGAMLQQTVLLHCRHLLAPALKAGSREGYAERFAGCADFAVTAAAIHGGLLGAMMLQVEVAPGPQFPLPVRRFVFKAGPLTDKGLLALGAASIGQLRFNPAVAYSAFSFRSAF